MDRKTFSLSVVKLVKYIKKARKREEKGKEGRKKDRKEERKTKKERKKERKKDRCGKDGGIFKFQLLHKILAKCCQ